MTTHHRSVRLPLSVAVATLLLVASSAAAAQIDPALYDTGVPAGQVEHGVMSFVITGSPEPVNNRIEYWLMADRWREITRDAKTGELVSGRQYDSTGTTWLQYRQVNNDPRITHFKGEDRPPGPGFTAPFNRKYVTTGVRFGNGLGTLQPIGPRTIAGYAGTAYEQLTDGEPGIEHTKGSHAVVVIQNDTYQPLQMEFTGPNQPYGQFDQRETLLSREVAPIGRFAAQLSKASFARTVSSWRAKVKAAKAAKKKHKK